MTNSIVGEVIDVLSGEYLNGEFQGATGGKPDPNFWLASRNYREGFLRGTEDYFNNKFLKKETEKN